MQHDVVSRRWIGLGVLSATAFLTSVDVFVLLLALPDIARDLDATAAEQLWITDVYGFLLVGCMLTAGTLGDRIGRRRVLFAGAMVFALASVAAAFAPTPLLLILARAVLGMAGATLAPATLGLITAMFPVARERTLAISIWQMCFMGGALAGPIIGGVLLEHFWWGAVFLIGVPAMLVLLTLGPWTVPEARASDAGRLDLFSVVLSLGAILPLVYALKETAASGFGIMPALAAMVGVVSGLVFVRRQRRSDDPLLDVTLFADRRFAAIVLVMVLITVLSSLMFVVSQRLQLVDGLTPVAVALAMLPSAVTSILSVAATPYLVRIVRPAYLIAGGMVVAAFGAVLIATAADVVATVVGLALVTLGNSPAVPLGTTLILDAVPAERAGSGGAIAETGTELGFALGVAVLGSLAAVVYRSALMLPDGLTDAARAAATDGLSGAVGTGIAEVADAARAAYTAAVGAVGWSAVGVCALIALVVLTRLRRVPAEGAR